MESTQVEVYEDNVKMVR